MERGHGANHVTPSNDTSWSAHHPLWLKLKQIKPLPVIKHLGGSSPPSVASSPEKPARLGPTKRAQPSCCHHLRFSPEELRDFAPGFKQNKTKHQQATRTNVGILPAPSSRLSSRGWKMIRIGKQKSFLNLFKNCCGFAATLRIVICIVWFWTYTVHVLMAERDGFRVISVRPRMHF